MALKEDAKEVNDSLANGKITEEQARTIAMSTLACYNRLASNVHPGSDIYFPDTPVEEITKKPKGSSLGLRAIRSGTDFSSCNTTRLKNRTVPILEKRNKGMFNIDKPPQIQAICIAYQCREIRRFITALKASAVKS